MPDTFAIKLDNVSKIYQLHGSQRDQLVHILGLDRIGFKLKHPVSEHAALDNLSLEVPKGHRIGIIGRNGAGKTTLLKLLCGNFAPTRGAINVNGSVQALMTNAEGFHPEYTGRENANASLQYNGLAKDEYHDAMEGIIEFCELGEYLDQPFKTYSLGMQARLMFATSTAIKPDILIVDEVLGAGDAYFIAKSKVRVERLVSKGCTMLLVSHSMPQILELCNEVIWLENGCIRMRGDAFKVVKAYEENLYGTIEVVSRTSTRDITDVENSSTSINHKNKRNVSELNIGDINGERENNIKLQEPAFNPNLNLTRLPKVNTSLEFNFIAKGGISRWEGKRDLLLCGFTILTEHGETNTLLSLKPAKFVFEFIANREGVYACRYGISISNYMGQNISSINSPKDEFFLKENERRSIDVIFNPLQIGAGQYIVSINIIDYCPLELVNTAVRYDLLNRSFEFKVKNSDSSSMIQNQFFHSAEWVFD